MNAIRRHMLFISIWPAATLALLGGIAAENARHVTPLDAAPYHVRAAKAISSIGYTIGDWSGKDDELPPAAQQLLRPNAILSRTYVDNGLSHYGQRAQLIIVQCRDPRDMSGHYPPICYVNSGDNMVGASARSWKIGKLTIGGMEYDFERTTNGQTYRRTVYNFFIVPNVGVISDMAGLRKAAGNYQQRPFGAAQVQLVMPTQLGPDERDEIFATLVGGQAAVIEVLLNRGSIQ